MSGTVKIVSMLLAILMASLLVFSASAPVVYAQSGAYAQGSIIVKSGKSLLIAENSCYALNSNLVVESGATVYIMGRLDVKSNAMIMNYGTVNIYNSGSIRLDGKLMVAEGAAVQGTGTLHVLNRFDDISCAGTVTANIKAPAPVKVNGTTTVGGILLVNKQYDLPKNYGDGLDSRAYSAYLKMKEASGFDMSIISGFRSYEKQESTFQYWCSVDGYEVAITYSAEPGHSEHQTGLAMDITSLNQSYGDTAEGRWLANHCHEYGFIIRYPKGKTSITGYMYEPWHVRYLGKSTAKLVHDSGLTLEEFLGVA